MIKYFLIALVLLNYEGDKRIVEGDVKLKSTTRETTYCSDLATCEPDKCCNRFGAGLFGGVGRCEPLRIEGQPCDLGCACAPGLKCASNPLCPKCRTICVSNDVVSSLAFYLNRGCFSKCKDDFMNHLFKPTKCAVKSVRDEGESCNEWCKCVSGTYCAPNILCKHCDHICMNMNVVQSLVHYFNVGCLNCHDQQTSVVFGRGSTRFYKLNFDTNEHVVFPTNF